MNLSLTNLKEKLKNARFIIIAIIIILTLLGFIIFQQIQKSQYKQQVPSDVPLSLKRQPVIDGKFDGKAQISQRSQKAIESLKSFLPYRKTVTTSTGQEATFAVFGRPENPYTLYIETLNINFRSTYDDPNLPKNVQDFRDAAHELILFLKMRNINPSDVFISWGSIGYIQDNAEAWLVESPAYPKVINQNGKFVFEKPPIR